MLTIFCLFQLVVNLAIVVYHALDYTHGEDEERLISPDLEGLITEMTAGNITGEYFVIFGKMDLDSSID